MAKSKIDSYVIAPLSGAVGIGLYFVPGGSVVLIGTGVLGLQNNVHKSMVFGYTLSSYTVDGLAAVIGIHGMLRGCDQNDKNCNLSVGITKNSILNIVGTFCVKMMADKIQDLIGSKVPTLDLLPHFFVGTAPAAAVEIAGNVDHFHQE